MKACVGAGRLPAASGAQPWTMVILSVLNLSLLRFISSTASDSFSMANTCPLYAARAHSTETEPVPAPMSHTTESAHKASFAIEIARTSAFVIGTSPRTNLLSSIPKRTASTASGFSISTIESGSKSPSESSAALPLVTFSSGYDSLSPTVQERLPKPYSFNFLQTADGVFSPPVRRKTFLFFSTAFIKFP